MARWGWPARAHARPPAASPRLLRGLFAEGTSLPFGLVSCGLCSTGKSAEIGFFLPFLLILHGFSFAFGPVKRRSDPPSPSSGAYPLPLRRASPVVSPS